MSARPDLAEPMGRTIEGFGTVLNESDHSAGAVAPYQQGQVVMMATGREITAKRVPLPRDMGGILKRLKVYCAAFGDTYVYSWEANDRANSRKETIEGGTIKLANDLVQLYGNCSVDCDVQENPTHIIFKAWFLDYETGTSVSRLFQQRKDQNTGMNRKDGGRAADLIFQIGQSKAIRNVVLNALSSLTNYAIEEAKRGLLDKFKDEEAKNKAWAFINRVMEDNGIEIRQVEAVVGRRENDWTIRDLAKVYQEMRGIFEGFLSATEVYPSLEEAEKVAAGKDAANVEGRRTDGRHDRKAETDRAAREEAEAGGKPASPAVNKADTPIHSSSGKTPGPHTLSEQDKRDLEDIPDALRRTKPATNPAGDSKSAAGADAGGNLFAGS